MTGLNGALEICAFCSIDDPVKKVFPMLVQKASLIVLEFVCGSRGGVVIDFVKVKIVNVLNPRSCDQQIGFHSFN